MCRYEDEHLLIVNKPAGMVVHPAPGSPNGTFVNALLHHLGDNAVLLLNGISQKD
jgi:23S rRNA pseudouridine1911/1915/1917 synthase